VSDFLKNHSTLHAGVDKVTLDASGTRVFRTGTGAPNDAFSLSAACDAGLARMTANSDPNLKECYPYFSKLRSLMLAGVDYRDIISIDREVCSDWASSGVVTYFRDVVDTRLAMRLSLNPRHQLAPPFRTLCTIRWWGWWRWWMVVAGDGGGGRGGGRNGSRGQFHGRGKGRADGKPQTCWAFNSAQGCTRQQCIFPHPCSSCTRGFHVCAQEVGVF
jgi:hypothetical protein